MAFTFPLSAQVFADRLKVQGVRFWRERYDESSGTARGDILISQIAFPKWRADVELVPAYHPEAAEIQALVELLEGPGRAFYLYSPAHPFPAADPNGTALGASTPTLHTVGANNRSCRIGGLPAGYTISGGDLFAVDYGSNPVRRGLFRAAETVQASGAGLTPLFDISGHFQAGVTTGLAVMLRKPAAKMQMVPGTFSPGNANPLITQGMAFQAIEAL